MTQFERFSLSHEDSRFTSLDNGRNIAMVAIFGPAIAGEANALSMEQDVSELDAMVGAVHSALSSTLLREFPDATQRNGLEHALKEFDDGFGMRGGFPTPTSWHDGRDSLQVKIDAIREGRAKHREAMAKSRYTVTLGQAVETFLPYMDTFDKQTEEMFREVFPHFLSQAFQSVWGSLLDQDTHVQHFSGLMDYLFMATEYGNPREVPEIDEHGYLNLGFVMTEADVRRMFAEPIARAFHKNTTENGEVKRKYLSGV